MNRNGALAIVAAIIIAVAAIFVPHIIHVQRGRAELASQIRSGNTLTSAISGLQVDFSNFDDATTNGSNYSQKRHDAGQAGASAQTMYDDATRELHFVGLAEQTADLARSDGQAVANAAQGLDDPLAIKTRSDVLSWYEMESESLDSWYRAIEEIHDNLHDVLNGRFFGEMDNDEIANLYNQSEHESDQADRRREEVIADEQVIATKTNTRISAARVAAGKFW